MKTSNFCKAVSAMLLLFVLCGNSAHAQNVPVQKQDSIKPKFTCGIGVSGSISNDGFGLNMSPCFSIRHKLSTLSVGPNMQMLKGNFSGINFSYEYTFDTIERCKNMQMFLQSNITYDMGAYLNSKGVADERAFSENYSGVNVAGIENWKFKIIEYSAGFGIRKEFNNFELSASVGIGGFHTYYNPALWRGSLHREMTITIVQFQTGIRYMF